jgi:hypothetical protein
MLKFQMLSSMVVRCINLFTSPRDVEMRARLIFATPTGLLLCSLATLETK